MVLVGLSRQITILQLQSASGLHLLPEATLAPKSMRSADVSSAALRTVRRNTYEPEILIRVLQATIDVFQTAVSSQELFDRAVERAIDLIGLDSASVVLHENGKWSDVVARHGTATTSTVFRPASRQVLDHLVQHRRTFWDTGIGAPADGPASLVGVDAVIAAPILDRREVVIGALYGDQKQSHPADSRPRISSLDAMLLELLACSVSSGLDRMAHEDSARRMRLQFEQFFTAQLARELETCPDLLKGRDADVTTLFCDIRGFSRISEKIGTTETFNWINDVMGALSESVTRFHGVLVDYIGDELIAMWGAPREQSDHSELACRAALDMLAQIPRLNERWQSTLDEPMGFGIGVHSGRVRAGNCGSQYKFKYGPLGSDVNLASRVQGATKYLKAPLLITGATAACLGAEFLHRKLCDVRVVNIHQPVPLFELMTSSEPSAPRLRTIYEGALAQFERGEFRDAAVALAGILNQHRNDGPSLVLLSRTVNAMVDGPLPQHPVWELPGK